ncbi:MAG: hypothetical protein AAGA69_03215 [Pseudomonadota bacterium]
MGKTAARVMQDKRTDTLLIFILLISLLLAPVAAADVKAISPTDDLVRTIRDASPGDIIRLREGRYAASDVRIAKDLTLEGVGEVVLYSPKPVAKGLLVPVAGVTLTVRDMTFEGARSPDKNGAGIRFEGIGLTIIRCTFRHNENGILATGDEAGFLKVRNSMFWKNGHGDGYSHGIYQAKGQRFDVRNSRFIGTRTGHHLKTLASDVTVTGHSFDDADGKTSYVLDVPRGGKVLFAKNSIIRRHDAAQRNLINYSTHRGGTVGKVAIRNNRVQSERRNLNWLRNPDRAPTDISGNSRTNVKRGEIPLPKFPATPATTNKDAPATPGDLTPPPAVPQGTAGTGEMVFRLRRTRPEGGFATYGQVFAPGDIPAGMSLAATAGGKPLPIQMDIKATHSDGSVRHAVLTAKVPQGSGEIEGNYLPNGAGGTPLTWSSDSFRDVTLRLTGTLGGGATTRDIDVAAMLAQGQDWLRGPLAIERLAQAEASPLLTVRIDGRQYKDGTARLRLTFENHKTFSSLPRDLAYNVRLMKGGETLFFTDVAEHYRHAGWTVLVPMDHEPAAEAVPNLGQLASAGAVLPYDGDTPVVVNDVDRSADPVLPGTVYKLAQYMPTTGGRRDIGPMTHWGAAWAIEGSRDARHEILRMADLGLTIPWSFAEDETSLPVRVDQRSAFWADARGAGKGKDKFPKGIFNGERPGGWVPDLAHKPQLAYPAYLATGEAVYARALAHEAGYALSAVWPDKREGGYLVTKQLQLRSAAWSLRTIGNAAWILPDDDPLKDYFIGARNANLDDLFTRYVAGGQLDAAGETEGWIDNFSREGPGAHAAWQGDFLAMAVAQETLRGSPRAREVLDWMSGYIIGRVLNIEDVTLYAGSRMTLLDDDLNPVSSWVQAATLTKEDFPNMNPFVSDARGYYAILRGTLGAIHGATGNPSAVQALDKMRLVPDADQLYREQNKRGRNWNAQFNIDSEK